MSQDKNYEELREFCLVGGADLFGVADVSRIKKDFNIPPQVLKNLDRGVSLGVRLSNKILETIEGHPTKIYFHHYRQINNFLDQLALKVVSFIQKKGKEALSIPASQIVDWEKQRGHLSHKLIAERAGLGWLGRNNLVVNPDLGARFRLVTILTDMDLPVDKPTKEGCGECKKCLTVCPIEAIKERQEDFDHPACYRKLVEFRKEGHTEQFICGICVKACVGKINTEVESAD